MTISWQMYCQHTHAPKLAFILFWVMPSQVVYEGHCEDLGSCCCCDGFESGLLSG